MLCKRERTLLPSLVLMRLVPPKGHYAAKYPEPKRDASED